MPANPCVNTLKNTETECEANKNAGIHSRFHPEYHPYMSKRPVGLQPMSAGMREFRKESGYDRELAEAKGTPCQIQSPVCTGTAEHLHEDKTRGRNGGLRGAIRAGAKRFPACDPCNGYVNENQVWAMERGFLVSNKKSKNAPRPASVPSPPSRKRTGIMRGLGSLTLCIASVARS